MRTRTNDAEAAHSRKRRRARAATVLAVAIALPANASAAAFADTPERPDTVQQRAFESAAAEFDVPTSLLMAVSFQLTRWEDHHGEQSRAGGYGPMHLVEIDEQELRERNPKLVKLGADPTLHTLTEAAELVDGAPEDLKADPVANIRAGAALLADRALDSAGELPEDVGGWYPAVAELSGDPDTTAARSFADDVYDVLGQGRARTTSTGQRLAFPKIADAQPATTARPAVDESELECPEELDCRYIPAAYEPTDPEDPAAGYGNYDTANRPDDFDIDSIVIHDTEVSYESTITAFQNPAHGAAAHYVVRSSDGQITQMVPVKDMAWHAGSWERNTHSIGIEHEGWAAEGGTWYTEPMYRASAKLVRHLADEYDIPLDREHILGHDEVTAEAPAKAGGEHYDPGPFWDWTHYMELIGAPSDSGTADGDAVTINPDFETNRPEVTSCPPDEDCQVLPAQPANFLYLRTEPRDDAPLLSSPVLHPDGGPGTTKIDDWGNKAGAGRQYAVAERSGDWLAIWFDGQKAWLHDPDGANTAAADDAELRTPVRDGIPTYGRPLPAAADYPDGIEPEELEPLPYTIPAGQAYVTGSPVDAIDYYATYDELDDPNNHTQINGSETYVPVSYNHRWVYVKQSDLERA
ncbi:N-acetylmuramoyl-L-alanine amidase [Saccharopolyspora gloriosae]|uniref:N-acetylmuramoyl-L-alanine amidase n=1 Tax=Saccharopolyspora gloriosae TaxID=455344 RepID=UPI001FB6FB93|nr:peptidoglycan recognition family protein [Saccharopolyspora gloriosae]